MVRPAENSEKETLKNFPQENRNPDEKERERAMFVYNSIKLQSKTEIERKWILQKAKSKKKKSKN